MIELDLSIKDKQQALIQEKEELLKIVDNINSKLLKIKQKQGEINTLTIKKEVIRFFADLYNVGEEELLGPSRVMEIREPRQLAILILRDYNYTCERIGKVFNKSHSAISVMYKVAREKLKTDTIFNTNYNYFYNQNKYEI